VLAGDRNAFRPLIEREHRAVIQTCHRILGNLPDAEDAAQEAFVTAYRALGTWRGEGPFGAWLGRIAIRVALRQARRRGAVRQLAWIEPPAGQEGYETAGRSSARSPADLPGHVGRDDPANIVLRSERADRVRLALANLDDPYREVLALRFFGELSIAEIAAEMGRPVPTVKTHLRRGLLRLRESLADER
jgi:RNA polymerase sigma-70 factor (ECF subfamily)